jgi:hypothetical protein
MHAEDVRVLQPCGQPDLAPEALRPQGLGQLRVEHLEGDRPLVPQVPGQVDGGHPAAAELALDRVAAGQGGLELCAEVAQRWRSWGHRELPPSSLTYG